MPTRERYPYATVVPVSSSLRDVVGAPPAGQTARVGELNMVRVKRWFVGMVVGGMLLVGLTSCVVVPVEVAPPGYVVSPPVVVVPPYRPYRYYEPYRDDRPYCPYYGGYPYGHRW
jgi:hypothetical protein